MSALSRSRGRLAKVPPPVSRAPAVPDRWTADCDPQAYCKDVEAPTAYNGSMPDTLPTGTHVFQWPTGDPRRPSGFLTFAPSPPPSPPLTPTKQDDEETQPPSQSRPSSLAKRDSKALTAIANLFQGESAPINLGLIPSPTKELDDQMEWAGLAKRGPTLTTRPSSPAKSTRGSPNGGRFSLFSGLLSPAKSEPTSGTEIGQSMDREDAWLNLDVRTALRPDVAGDTPPSFESLLAKAETLLSEMQDAYRSRVVDVADAQAEVAAQEEETEEAKTRAKHLKNQLDELSTKGEEQDNVIMSLVQDLAEEKEARHADARARTIRVIDTDVAKYGKKSHRQSAQSMISDSGFESNNDSVDSPDDETIDGHAPASAVSYCSSPELEIARSASLNRGAASLVYTGSRRVSNIKRRESIQSTIQRFESNQTQPRKWNGARKPVSRAPSAAIELCQQRQENDTMASKTNEELLREENLQLQERNKFLEVELEAVKRMIEDVMQLAPSGTSSRKNSEDQCT